MQLEDQVALLSDIVRRQNLIVGYLARRVWHLEEYTRIPDELRAESKQMYPEVAQEIKQAEKEL